MKAANKEDRMLYDRQAREIVSKMSLEEKVHLMSGSVSIASALPGMLVKKHHYNWYPYPAGGNKKHNVPPMKFCDGPRGVVCGNDASTCFPVAMARGATFDKKLEEQIGEAIGKEIRAYGGNLFGGVCVNVPYNPGWGRSQEVFGEDPFHLGAMASATITGVQKHNVIACTKQEVFLPQFKDCVEAGAASIMSSYNRYQGIHCGHSDYLLNRVLKKEWGFDGFVMSDFGFGVRDTVEAANGGMDIEMCNTKWFGKRLVAAVKSGKVPESKIDEAAIRIVRTLNAFTGAEDPMEYPESIIGCEDHRALALKAAEEGITLLKNNNTLPFSREKVKKLAVIGKLANAKNIGDHGSSQVYPKHVVTPLEGLKNIAPLTQIIYCDGRSTEEAKKAAKEADAVIFVAGYNHNDEGEYLFPIKLPGKLAFGGDRATSLGLHEADIELIQAVAPENRNSVAVLIGGNMIMTNPWDSAVSSILMAYYPGQEGGTALAKILFGDVNPSGKTPFSTPCHESDLPQVNWDTKEQVYGYYHGYTKLDRENKKPRYPFGFGLSYTDFQVSNPSVKIAGDYVTAECDVNNTGKYKGDAVIQFYVGTSQSKADRPVKLLRGFERSSLEPDEMKHIVIECPIDKLRYFNDQEDVWELEDITYEAYIGTSSAEEDLHKCFFSLESKVDETVS